MKRMKLVLGLFAMVFVMAASRGAEAVVVGTFPDPAVGSGSPTLFTFTAGATGGDPTGATIAESAQGLAAVLQLDVLGTITSAKFTMPTLTATGNFSLINGGYEFAGPTATSTITFFDALLNPLETIQFTKAFVNLSNFGGATATGSAVNITVPGWTLTTPENFSFAFGDGTDELGAAFAAGGGATAGLTASFTSSAFTARRDIPVPEPASMLLLGTGLVGLGARLRRRK